MNQLSWVLYYVPKDLIACCLNQENLIFLFCTRLHIKVGMSVILQLELVDTIFLDKLTEI
jgi:hypothetical protein